MSMVIIETEEQAKEQHYSAHQSHISAPEVKAGNNDVRIDVENKNEQDSIAPPGWLQQIEYELLQALIHAAGIEECR